MENNIDKDIEILKEHINFKTQFTLLNHEQEQIEAIENVLKALEGKDCVIETQAHNEEVYEELVEKLEKELETYKKIAEKLADELYVTKTGDEICKNADHSKCVQRKVNCTDCIIDWARKEVEK